MKKRIIVMLAAIAACGGTVEAQQPEPLLLEPESKVVFKPDTLLRHTNPVFTLPDSLAHLSPWRPDYETMGPMRTKPKISMSSIVEIQRENLPSRVTVIDNNTLRLGPHFTVSNGQAWNWSPFPDAYLDARTLSFPMR